MVMKNKSSDEILASIKENYEKAKIEKYDAFRQKYFYREIIVTKKQNEVKNKIQGRALESRRRHNEAAERRKALLEEKKNKIMTRRQSRSESRDSKSSSVSEIQTSSRPGVFIANVISTSNSQGTAGFGKGYIKKSDELCLRDLDHRFKRFPDQRKSCESWEEELISQKPRVDSQRKYIISEKQLIQYIQDSKQYRAMKNTKNVSFDSSKHADKRISKPIIKKSLQIDTPETKKGILMKMTEMNLRKKMSRSPKFEKGSHIIPNESLSVKIKNPSSDLAGHGDFSRFETTNKGKKNLNTEAKTTGDQVPNISLDPTPPLKREILDKNLKTCGNFLERRKSEKKNRKLKLFQLHEDLKFIGKETQRLTKKHETVTEKLMSKAKCFKENLQSKSFLQNYFHKPTSSEYNCSDSTLESLESSPLTDKEILLFNSNMNDSKGEFFNELNIHSQDNLRNPKHRG